MTDVTYKAEADIIRRHFDRAKAAKRMTQDDIVAALGVTQPTVSSWLTGRRRVPDEKLLKLSVMLGFDPREVRPEITQYVDLANTVLSGDSSAALLDLLHSLSTDERAQVEAYVKFLVTQRKG